AHIYTHRREGRAGRGCDVAPRVVADGHDAQGRSHQRAAHGRRLAGNSGRGPRPRRHAASRMGYEAHIRGRSLLSTLSAGELIAANQAGEAVMDSKMGSRSSAALRSAGGVLSSLLGASALWMSAALSAADGIPRMPDGHPDLTGTWDNGSGIDFVQPLRKGD